jgi:glycosyltransferase involved in cell wall biosynthesis
VLAVSHACVIDVNQRLFADLGSSFGLEIGVVAPRRWRTDLRGDLPFTALADLHGPIYQRTPVFSGRGSLYFYPGARGIVRSFRPDIVHLDEEPWSLSAWQFAEFGARAGAKVFFYTKENISKSYPPPFRSIERRVYRLSACAVALTTEVEQVLRARGFTKPVFTIPHAVDLAQFGVRDASDLRRRLGLKGTVVGYVGRLTEEKGITDLIRALTIVKEAGNAGEMSALIIGNGPLEPEVRAAAASDPRIQLVAAIPHNEIQQYYSCIDILVVPSRTTPRWKEQFGRVLIEALASGAAVIGSDSGEIPHVITATGGGVVFPEGDAPALAAAILSLLRDPARRQLLADTGRATVLEKYSAARVAAQFHDVYEWLSRA